MADKTEITWCDSTLNFWIGCMKVSPACKNCYAAVDTFARRERANGNELWGPGSNRHRTSESYWRKPYSWNKQRWLECTICGWRGTEKDASLHGCGNNNGNFIFIDTRQRVFVSSLSDICEKHPQITDEWRREIARIVTDCENIDFMFLTKRPENFNGLWLDHFGGVIPDWVWVGASTENQAYAERRIYDLVQIKAKTLFISCGPLLGPIQFDILEHEGDEFGDGAIHWNMLTGERWMRDGFEKELTSRHQINMVVVEGESGSNARPMHPDWVRSIRDQCRAGGVPFHFKQWGEWYPTFTGAGTVPGSVTKNYLFPDGQNMWRVGKKAAGRMLDGEIHNSFPYNE